MNRPTPLRVVLLGHPVKHSLSPALQNAALRARGIPLVYEALDVAPEHLDRVWRELREGRSAGNVTIPHKEAVHGRCDRVTDVAARVGAVNTFWTTEAGDVIGDNTDVTGFEAAARHLGVLPGDRRVACLGSGGSAAAVCAVVSAWPGARVTVVGRNPARAAALAARFGPAVQLATSSERAVSCADLVVNATPLGLFDDALPVAIGALPRDARVMDFAYRAGETHWVREARRAGHAACDGREMLLHQGAAAFERWFAAPPPIQEMRQALSDALDRDARPSH